jgi:hypothetical protein
VMTIKMAPRRAELLRHLDEVTLWPDGQFSRYVLGRAVKVNADMAWLINAKLAETNPDDEDLDLKGVRPTGPGQQWLADNTEPEQP